MSMPACRPVPGRSIVLARSISSSSTATDASVSGMISGMHSDTYSCMTWVAQRIDADFRARQCGLRPDHGRMVLPMPSTMAPMQGNQRLYFRDNPRFKLLAHEGHIDAFAYEGYVWRGSSRGMSPISAVAPRLFHLAEIPVPAVRGGESSFIRGV